MNPTAVIIARFQTPYLHEGHQQLINEIKQSHHKVVIVLGIAPLKTSKRNPFDFYTREKMLKQADAELVVLPLSDHPSDLCWSNNLDQLLRSAFPNEQFILYGGRQSFINNYHGILTVKELPEYGTHSATAIRNDHADKVLNSVDFRMGINYAMHNSYSKVYPTVDVALFRNNREEVLLGKKPNRNGWRLPGGFADPTDESYEHSAKRELTEECGIIETASMQYLGSCRIDDWRYKQEGDKILTILFATDLIYGSVSPSDDLERLQWVKVSALENMMTMKEIVEEHLPLLRLLLQTAFSNFHSIIKN